MIRWKRLAIQEALIAFDSYEGSPEDRMRRALHCAAVVQGLNGEGRKIHKKERMSPEAVPSDEQLAAYRQIVRDELEKFDLTWDHLIMGGQMRPVVDCRWMIIWRVRKETRMSYPYLGKLLEVDHSSCVNAFERMQETDGKYYINRAVSAARLADNREKLRKLDERLSI